MEENPFTMTLLSNHIADSTTSQHWRQWKLRGPWYSLFYVFTDWPQQLGCACEQINNLPEREIH